MGKATGPNTIIRLPMIRIQIRVAVTSISTSLPCSGAFVLDLHDMVLSAGSSMVQKPATRFADPEVHISSSPLMSAECGRIVIACSPVGIEKATAVLSLGPLISVGEIPGHIHEGPPTSYTDSDPTSYALRPSISLARPSDSQRTPGTLAFIASLPSAHILLSKAVLDDLQYWADDATQLVERTFGNGGSDTDRAESRDTSLIGSRFFARSRRSDSDGSTLGGGLPSSNTETVIKVIISEGEYG